MDPDSYLQGKQMQDKLMLWNPFFFFLENLIEKTSHTNPENQFADISMDA